MKVESERNPTDKDELWERIPDLGVTDPAGLLRRIRPSEIYIKQEGVYESLYKKFIDVGKTETILKLEWDTVQTITKK